MRLILQLYTLIVVLMIATACFLAVSKAHAYPVPNLIVDSEITVKLKNGEVHKFSGNEYKVVKRTNKITKIPSPEMTQERMKKKTTSRNIISLRVLNSKNGLKVQDKGSEVIVENDRMFGLGVMYQRNIFEELYLGVDIDSNSGLGLSIGKEF